MLTVSENKVAKRWLVGAAVVSTVLGSTLIAVYLERSESPQASEVQASAPSASPVFGPGAWTGAAVSISTSDRTDSEWTRIEMGPPAGLAVTDKQELVVNPALLDLINYFLLEQQGDQARALIAHLKSHLPDPAFQQAAKLVGEYQAYMAAHDSLLAGQNLGVQDGSTQAPELSRIASWSEQRDRLRRSMLGDEATEAWYRNDDAQLKQLIDELRQKWEGGRQDRDPSLQDAGPRPPIEQHWSDMADEVRHNRYMQNVLSKAATSYSALAGERRDWTDHYAAFVEAAGPLYRNASLDPFERTLQMKSLLRKFFSSEPDRQLAQRRWESLNGSLN